MEFLKRKWSLYFTLIDVDHDGLVTKADVDKTLQDFPIVEGLTEETGKLADERLEKWWNTYILKGRDKITEEEFVNDLETQYTTDKKSFLETIITMEEEICTILNCDKTTFVSLDEYIKALKVFGHDREDLIRTSFKMYKPEDGMVPLQEFIDDWVQFLSGDDEKNPGVVMETFLFWVKAESE